MNFTSLIRGASRRYPDNDAVVTRGATLSFRELWRSIAEAGALYRGWGVKSGDRVLVLLPNGPGFLAHHFAAMKIGAVSVPLKPEYRSWELNRIIADCGPTLLISDDAWLDGNERLLDLPSELRVVSVDRISGGGAAPDPATRPVANGALASINYSYFGGGIPKGAMLSHANHIYAATGYALHIGFRPDDRLLIAIPMSHVYALSGCVNSGLIRGAALVIVPSYRPRTILRAIEEHRATVLSTVPAVYEMLGETARGRRRYDLSSLRLCVTGGDYMSAARQQDLEQALGAQVVQGYGLTECLPVICNPPGEGNRHGTLGIPGRRDIEIRIVDGDARAVGPGRVGGIAIRSKTTMLGYHRLPTDTREILVDGWLHTGDEGYVDEAGHLHFRRMTKRIFNLHGNKVDPLEVERLLLEHADVEAAELYVEREEGGDARDGAGGRLAARVDLRAGAALEAPELRAFLNERIAAYKVPRSFAITSSSSRAPSHIRIQDA